MTDKINTKTDSKNNTSSSIDYVVLTLETKEYRKLNNLEKKNISIETNETFSEYRCKNCSSKNLEYYKWIYSVQNMQNYEKKNTALENRHEEFYYLYAECSSCNSKNRIGDKMYPNITPKIPEKKKILEKMYSWIEKYL